MEICVGISLKPVAISITYFVVTFSTPFFSTRRKSILIFLTTVTTFYILLQILYQIYLYHYEIDEETIAIIKDIGFVCFTGLKYVACIFFNPTSSSHFINRFDKILLWIAPETVLLLSSCIISLKKSNARDGVPQNTNNAKNLNTPLKRFGVIFSLCSLCICGALVPSITNGIYFISFLIFATLLACNSLIGRKFALCLQAISAIIGLHIITLTLYQMTYFQNVFPKESLAVKALGLHQIPMMHVESFRSSKDANIFKWDAFAHLPVLIVTYLVVACTARLMKIDRQGAVSVDEESVSVKAIDENEEIYTQTKPSTSKQQKPFSLKRTAKNYLWDNAYIVTIFSMMIWSILYHSWLSFVFLLMSNVIWVLPKKSLKIVRFSPLIVGYAILQILLSYTYEMDICTANSTNTSVNWSEIGIVKDERYPVVNLVIKVLLTLPFLVTLRQKFVETPQTLLIRRTIIYAFISRKIRKTVIFAWMWIIAILLLCLALYGDDEMTLFRIANMSFFLAYVLIFQLSFNFWKSTMHTYWIILIGYAISYLTLIYLYQFKNVPQLPFNIEAIGFQKYDTKELFLKLLSFTLITIVTGVQLNYFDPKLNSYLGKEVVADESSDGNKSDNIFKAFLSKFLHIINLHSFKIYFLIAFWQAAKQMQVLNIFIMILTSIGVVAKSQTLKDLIVKFITILSMMFVVAVMLFEFSRIYIPIGSRVGSDCDTEISRNTTEQTIFTLRSFYDWFNIEDNLVTAHKISIHLTLITASTLLFALRYYQDFANFGGILKVPFENITRNNAEKSIANLLKYFMNYGFYHFGNDVTLVVFASVMLSREDIISVLYIPIFITLIFNRGNRFKRNWGIAKFIVTLSIILQCMGIAFFVMVKLCLKNKDILILDMNWNFVIRALHQNIQFLYNNPHKTLCWDFLLLTTMSCHFFICKYGACSNSDEKAQNASSTIECIKLHIYKNQFWITTTIILIAALRSFDLFTMGYVTFTLVFLWQGMEFYLRDKTKVQNDINNLLAYNIFAMTVIICTKMAACYFRNEYEAIKREILQVFQVACNDSSHSCSNANFDSINVANVIIFCQILLQRGIFESEYFLHVYIDTFVSSLLSSRGAELIEELRIREIKKVILEEKNTLHHIKKKMDVIKRMSTSGNAENLNHDLAVRNGDYYMYKDDFFDDVERERSSRLNLTEPLARSSSQSEFRFDIDDDLLSENSKESIKKVSTKAESSLKHIVNDLARKFMQSLRNSSRKHNFVAKSLEGQAKVLKNAISKLLPKDVSKINLENLETMLIDSRVETFKRLEELGYEKLEPPTTVRTIFHDVACVAMTHSDLIVYFLIFLNQTMYANVLSLTLPLLVFMWGTFIFPRPTKFFWTTLIAFAQTIFILKCIAQYDFGLWVRNSNFDKKVGLHVQKNFAVYDIILLIAMYLHRAILIKFGVWNTNKAYSFKNGIYLLEKTDKITSRFLEKQRLLKMMSNSNDDEKDAIDNETPLESSSEMPLIVDSTIFNQKLEKNQKEEKERNEAANALETELFSASEKFLLNYDGNRIICLCKDSRKLYLRSISQVCLCKEMFADPEKVVIVEDFVEDARTLFPTIIVQSFKRYMHQIIRYVKELIPKYRTVRRPVDMYTLMFLCGFINFFVLLFGFSQFAVQVSSGQQEMEDSKNIVNFIEENKVPQSLLLLLIIQFMIIIVDRIIYVRKSLISKIILQFVIVITTHIWLFFFLPTATGRDFNSTLPPIIFYGIRFVYILISAYQIRCGYPKRILGNFLMKNYNVVHMCAFKMFLIIPFLFELRTLIDWTFTPTSLTFAEWMRVETIYAHLFEVKCKRHFNRNVPRGIQRSWLVKSLMGGGLVFIIIFILWLPLLFFAYTHNLGESSLPNRFSMSVRIGNVESLYRMNMKADNMHQFGRDELKVLKVLFENYPRAAAYLEDFNEEDIALLQMSSVSSSIWNISPPSLKKLKESLEMEQSRKITLLYEISQIGYMKDKDTLLKYEYELTSEDKMLLLKTIEGTSNEFVTLVNTFPKFLYIANTGRVSLVNHLNVFKSQQSLRNLKIKMEDDNMANSSKSSISWWKVLEDCSEKDPFYKEILQHIPGHDCKNYLNFIMFNEKSFPSQLSSFAGKGIIGLYVTVIVIAARFIRNTVINSGNVSIIIEELPNVDKILNLCKNIYMVREAQQFSLEEDLVAKLIFLFRSPETLIKITRHREC